MLSEVLSSHRETTLHSLRLIRIQQELFCSVITELQNVMILTALGPSTQVGHRLVANHLLAV